MDRNTEEEVTDSAARLTILHQDEGDYTSRTIHLWLDHKKIASLKSGKQITLEINPGKHALQVDNTFTKKKETFEVRPGEHLRYVTRNRAGFGSSLISILGAGPLYLTLRKETEAVSLG
jgi:hypothetical protein